MIIAPLSLSQPGKKVVLGMFDQNITKLPSSAFIQEAHRDLLSLLQQSRERKPAVYRGMVTSVGNLPPFYRKWIGDNSEFLLEKSNAAKNLLEMVSYDGIILFRLWVLWVREGASFTRFGQVAHSALRLLNNEALLYDHRLVDLSTTRKPHLRLHLDETFRKTVGSLFADMLFLGAVDKVRAMTSADLHPRRSTEDDWAEQLMPSRHFLQMQGTFVGELSNAEKTSIVAYSEVFDAEVSRSAFVKYPWLAQSSGQDMDVWFEENWGPWLSPESRFYVDRTFIAFLENSQLNSSRGYSDPEVHRLANGLDRHFGKMLKMQGNNFTFATDNGHQITPKEQREHMAVGLQILFKTLFSREFIFAVLLRDPLREVYRPGMKMGNWENLTLTDLGSDSFVFMDKAFLDALASLTDGNTILDAVKERAGTSRDRSKLRALADSAQIVVNSVALYLRNVVATMKMLHLANAIFRKDGFPILQDRPIVLYRFLELQGKQNDQKWFWDILSDLDNGRTSTFHGQALQSTTYNVGDLTRGLKEGKLVSWVESEDDLGQVMLSIVCPLGSRILYTDYRNWGMGLNHDEAEFLLSANAELLVSSYRVMPDILQQPNPPELNESGKWMIILYCTLVV